MVCQASAHPLHALGRPLTLERPVTVLEAARLDPGSPFHLSHLSDVAFARGDMKEAIKLQRARSGE